ncbi:hypothetical protein DH2020_035612 [Rehmannia glutinosa]|uniref:Glutaredoxin domain-containing protein n=1 Tax=Rehmannia glutinosa TaxID=99300 RepID=A0ABR0V5Z9_REHGL
MERESSDEKNRTIPPGSLEKGDQSNPEQKNKDIEQPANVNDPSALVRDEDAPDIEIEDRGKVNTSEKEVLKSPSDIRDVDLSEVQKDEQKMGDIKEKTDEIKSEMGSDDSKEGESDNADSGVTNENLKEVSHEEEEEPVFDGTEVPEMDANSSLSSQSSNNDSEGPGFVWPEKAVALTKFVRQKSLVAVSTVLRHLSGKSDDGQDVLEEDKDSSLESEPQEGSEKSAERSVWNPLYLIGISRDSSGENKSEHEDSMDDITQPIAMKGRIILYTRLGCQVCKEARKYLHSKRLRYVEINIDVYPTRKLELEKFSGSCVVPRIFFNEVLIGGLDELKNLDESGKLGEKIEYVVSETPSFEAPLPPLSGEDDPSSTGAIDELALIARKMKGSICVKDRFYKMRRFTNCFLGSEAVDFLTEDQYLEREEVSCLCFMFKDHIFEDGNHLYRFLDDDPFISQCQNISRGISEVKPKPIAEISSELRFLCYAILEAYASEDGRHVDYRSIHGSEEFARYLRIVEELQRVELFGMPREEKLSFFINLYNMMAIHAILVWGHPSRALERRKFFGDFKYVIGGFTYSLSAIYNGILRGNQRPPYNLIKPFGVTDRRLNVSLFQLDEFC